MKFCFDFIVSLFLLIILSPVIVIVYLLAKIYLGTPVVFLQERPGRNGQPFYLYKFRTMTDQRDILGNLLPDEYRLTPFGRTLRKLSIDEIPQLINVLKGDMSLIGPRPLLMRYYPYFTEREQLRHTVRPGITGLAQVSGRNNLGWNDRLELDVQYVENWSFKLDMEILIKTIIKVIKKDGIIEAPGTAMLNLDDERRK
jgi:sugar transferase EpsL